MISKLINLSDIFFFKEVSDERGKSYILLRNNKIESIRGIEDHVAFEAVENHVHIIDKVKKRHFGDCCTLGTNIGLALRDALAYSYPERRFVVFVSITVGESMIVRFHQCWEGETPYYDAADWSGSKEKVLCFET